MASKMWVLPLRTFRQSAFVQIWEGDFFRNRRVQKSGMGQIQSDTVPQKNDKKMCGPLSFGWPDLFFLLVTSAVCGTFFEGKVVAVAFVTGSLTRSTWNFSRQLSRQECLRDSNGWFPRVGSGTSLPSLKVELIWGLNVDWWQVCTWILQHEMLRLFWGQRNFGWRILLQCKKDIFGLKYRIIGWSIPVVNCYMNTFCDISCREFFASNSGSDQMRGFGMDCSIPSGPTWPIPFYPGLWYQPMFASHGYGYAHEPWGEHWNPCI